MHLSVAVLGVDPGVNGGMALLNAAGNVVCLQPLKPSMKEEEVVNAVRAMGLLLNSLGSNICFFETVGHITGDGGQGSFTFGYVKGLLRGALIMAGIKIHGASPGIWQSKMGCLTRGNKNVSKRKAIALFPNEKVTHAVADALLIAEYGRRQMSL